ncbi:MAG: hypothetical protein KC478_06130 [Bacteriovoracaceae bacterium]|nr:hypothetical protein [Bacteriovoracaceae bacterium]
MLGKLFNTVAVAAVLANPGYTCTIDGSEGIVPENDLKIPAHAKSISNSNLDQETFNAVIDKVTDIYAPIVSQMGGELKVEKNWEDGTVNAYASRTGDVWNVHMFGGLARHETITPDGFALVVCHELGHHIGGAPKKSGWWSQWATNEGQADYFATMKCLRKSFRGEDHNAVLSKLEVPQVVIDSCSEQFSGDEDRLICQRGSMAGLSTAKLFQALRQQTTAPSFETPDSKVVSSTNHNHPDTQCRLDTYYQGALCHLSEFSDVDQEDESVGVCYRNAGDTQGVRPFCWFKPATI